MIPGVKRARAAGAASPKRLVFFIFNNGTSDTGLIGYNSGTAGRPGSFWPKTLGPSFEMTPILQPLSDLKQDILVIRNLHNLLGLQTDSDHAGSTNAILTGVHPEKVESPEVRTGISVDQFAANTLKQFTPALPSLFLSHPFHSDYNGQIISWSGPTSRVYPSAQPSEAFKQVFGAPGADPKIVQKRIAYQKSVLHRAKADTDRLRKKLGKADQQTLDGYLGSVLSLEERISAPGISNGCTKPTTAPPDTVFSKFDTPDVPNYYTVYNVNLPEHMTKMSDLVRLAFQCDVTRVVTIQLMNHDLRFDWLGPPYSNTNTSTWHGDATHGGAFSNPVREAALDLYTAGCTAQVKMFAELVRKLKETPEGDGSGSLLDNSLLVCASEMSYGDGHDMHFVPAIVAGRAGGSAITLGRYIAAPPPEQPIANLWVTMLNAVGINVTSYGNSTGALSLT